MIELARSRAYFEVSDKLLELCNKLARKTNVNKLNNSQGYSVSTFQQYKAIHLIIYMQIIWVIFFSMRKTWYFI